MKLKTKLYLSFLFFFAIAAMLAGVGAYHLHKLSQDARAIIKDNFRTLNYMQTIQVALNEYQLYLPQYFTSLEAPDHLETATSLFRENLTAQLVNVTEPGEDGLSKALQKDFNELEKMMAAYLGKGFSDHAIFLQQILPHIKKLEDQSHRIYKLNEETILRKNTRAEATAEKAKLYITTFGFSGILVGLLFIWGLPVYISRPFTDLNEAIKQIAQKKYEQKLDFRSNDEFGEIATSFNYMAARLKEYEQSSYSKILFEKKRIDAIINQMSEAIIGIDEAHTVLFANPFALELLNMQEEALLERGLSDLTRVNGLLARISTDISMAKYTDQQKSLLKIIHQNREKAFSLEIIPISAIPTGESKQKPIGYVVVLTDITEFTEKDKAKTQFIATVSHELKTPIAAIQMTANLLKDNRIGTLNEEQQALVKTLADESNRLKSISSELLNLAQIETGKIFLNPSAVHPCEIIDFAVKAVEKQTEEKHLNIKIQCAETLPTLHIDRDKTAWVLVNLLINAIRYSPKKDTIFIKVVQESQSVLFSVEDHGSGIPEKIKNQLFIPFTMGSQGSGLGLSIAKEFVEAQGGKIWLDDSHQNKTIFLFNIPM